MSHSSSSIFHLGEDKTQYRLLSKEHVTTTTFEGKQILMVKPEALTMLAKEAFKDISHLLRPTHLANLRSILDDKDASPMTTLLLSSYCATRQSPPAAPCPCARTPVQP
jgi:fumarate hydratase class I